MKISFMKRFRFAPAVSLRWEIGLLNFELISKYRASFSAHLYTDRWKLVFSQCLFPQPYHKTRCVDHRRLFKKFRTLYPRFVGQHCVKIGIFGTKKNEPVRCCWLRLIICTLNCINFLTVWRSALSSSSKRMRKIKRMLSEFISFTNSVSLRLVNKYN